MHNQPHFQTPRKTSRSFFTRRLRPLAVSLILFTPAAIFAQTAGDSVPAGYNTLTAPGTGGAGGVKLSLHSPGLTPAVEWQGKSSAVGANTLTDSAAAWTEGQFNGANGAFYLEVTSVGGSTSAAGVGTTYTITATTAATKTLTFATNIAAGITSPVGYRIRKHWTVADIFGPSNLAGLQGGTAVSADHVLIWNGSGFDTCYYQTAGIGGTGWRKTGAQSVDAGGSIILPNQCLVVKRGQSAPLPFNVNGNLKAGQTSTDIAPGFNFLANPYAVDMTLAGCGLYTGNPATGLADGSAAGADLVMLWNGTAYDSYFYQTSGGTGTGWRITTDLVTDAGTTALTAGAGFVVRRTNPGAFTWTAPQLPAAL